MNTASTMARAANAPITVRNGIPETPSPSRAMNTVNPANTTAEPAIPTARAVDSSAVMPSPSWVRWRERMNRA